MNRFRLTDYLELRGVTQEQLATAIGVTKGAISQWSASDRVIIVVEGIDGSVTVVEEKVLGRGRPKRRFASPGEKPGRRAVSA